MKKNFNKSIIWTSFLLFLIHFPSATANTEDIIVVGHFSKSIIGDNRPMGWEPLTFKKIENHTRYLLVKDDNTVVVRAQSRSSASGLIKKITIDPKEYPFIEWRWKVNNIYKDADVLKKDGDDYPARIYITFEYHPSQMSFFERAEYETAKLLYGEYPPVHALNYIWGSHAEKGGIVPNPYTKRAMMIVIESGPSLLKKWVSERRNVYEDFKKAFDEDPPNISGIAIMTDSDNTRESSTAYYGDIIFSKR